jgi:hypothetical protein
MITLPALDLYIDACKSLRSFLLEDGQDFTLCCLSNPTFGQSI